MGIRPVASAAVAHNADMGHNADMAFAAVFPLYLQRVSRTARALPCFRTREASSCGRARVSKFMARISKDFCGGHTISNPDKQRPAENAFL
jgi:hypothetical protein